MLRIRLTRTGKTRQESFRIVVAPHTNAVKGKYLEMLGYYHPATQPKKLEVNKERVQYWIKNGAQPSDSLATLFKRNGFEGMDKFIATRNKKRTSKGDDKAATPAA